MPARPLLPTVPTVERHFLGWQQPCLPAAVAYLRNRYASGREWDIRSVLVVVPGGRAARRLLELLAEDAAGDDSHPPLPLVPPAIVTTGRLPEQLYAAPPRRAKPLESVVAWARALQSAGESLRNLIPNPPDPSEWGAWVVLARELGELHAGLAAEGLSFRDVAQSCRAEIEPFCDAERWEALEALHAEYLASITTLGLSDLHQDRFDALAAESSQLSRDVILISAVDLNRISRLLLEHGRARVTSLIHAPEEASDGYDDWGCLEPEWWTARRLEIPDSDLKVVDRPRDQALAVAEALRGFEGRYSPSQITVGLGDPQLSATVERTLELAGVPARPSVGRELTRTRPAAVLEAVARYLDDRRAEGFAGLLRHPDLENWLAERALASNAAHAGTRNDWLKYLDQYSGEHLPLRMGQFWASPHEREAAGIESLKALYDDVKQLVTPVAGGARPLHEWAQPIGTLLSEVYGGRELERGAPGDAELIRALEAIAGVLRELAELPRDDSWTPQVTGPQALTMVLDGLAGVALPREGQPDAVELLGWLELALDDAPALVVTGLNEGIVPESVNADAFLPDGLRSRLGMPDNRSRYVRDAAVLQTLLESRRNLVLIAGRRGESGDALAPSRLLFACDEGTLIARALTFYREGEPSTAVPRPLLPAGERTRFRITRPRSPARPVERLPVTAFRSYLACPYRFYLRHVLRLSSLADGQLEMEGGLFGRLLHDVLNDWGRGDLAGCTDAPQLAAGLAELLTRAASARFGAERPPAVEIQLFQARRRLESFAAWQATHAADGWKVLQVEADLNWMPDVDGEPFTILGRVDRIDHHPDHGYLVLDYKTGDKARSPDDVHRAARSAGGGWVDLQLPLYRRLIEAAGLNPDPIALGYICLPRELGGGLLYRAEWGSAELDEAEEVTYEIIRRVRRAEFWPPSPELPPFADDYTGICFDRCLNRSVLLQPEETAP